MLFYLPSFLSFFPLVAPVASSTTQNVVKDNKGLITFPVLPHSAVLQRRKRERRLTDATNDNDLQMGELYQGYGTHYVDLWVGSPEPQRQTVIVDTGSQITAFPCVECVDCGESYHTDNYFDFRKSETFKKLGCDECQLGHCYSNDDQCNMGLSYQEGSSWKAFESVDITYASASSVAMSHVENPHGLEGGQMTKIASDFSYDLHFGCQYKITGLFKTQLADGIMGMSNDMASFWDQMYKSGAIENQAFSLCFVQGGDVSKEGVGAGAMTLGGSQPLLHNSVMVFAKNIRSKGFYTVRVRSMYFRTDGGLVSWGEDDEIIKIDVTEADLNRGNVIVDSGTTDTYFNRALMQPFLGVWKEITGFDYKNDKLKLTDEQIELLPTILVQLEGDNVNQKIAEELNLDPDQIPGLAASVDSSNPYDIIIAITPSHYMEFDSDENLYYSRLYVDERSGSVLGANALQGHDVLFDNDERRIGWAESDCDYSALTGQNPLPVEDLGKDDFGSLVNEEQTKIPPVIDSLGTCTSKFCRSASILGLAFAGFLGVVSWNCFQGRKHNQSKPVPMDDHDNVLHDFGIDDDDDEEEELAISNKEII